MEKANSATSRHWLLALLKWTVVAAVLLAVGMQIHHRWTEAQQRTITLRPWWAVAAGALYLAGWLPAGLWWRRILGALGPKPPWWASIRAYFIGHLGKYVPGKALVIVLRATFIRAHGVSTGCAVAATVYETFTSMAVGALVAAVLLAAALPQQSSHVVTVSVIAVLGTVVLAVPAVFNRLCRWFAMLLRRSEPAEVEGLGPGTFLAAMAGLSAGWLLNGLSLGATLIAVEAGEHGVALSDVAQWPLWTAAVGLSIVAGFAAVWFPAGLGVREGILVEMLTPAVGGGTAVVAALAWRLITILGESVFAAVAYPLARSEAGVPATKE